MKKKLFLIIFIFSILVTPRFSSDLIANVMKDGVATFFDAARLIYYSFRSNEKFSTNKKVSENLKVKKYLATKGIKMSVDGRPISRQSFAKTVIQSFKLKTSWGTSLFSSESFYFKDAQRLGIFKANDIGSEALTMKELLKAYFRAESIK